MSQNPLALSTTGPLPGLTAVTGINGALDSLSRWLSGPTAPTASGLGLSSLSGMVWHDTAANTLKVRDQADSAWITVGSFDEANKLFQAASARESITMVAANQTITASSHFANLVASAAVTLTLVQTSVLGNGACAFSLSAQGGAVTLAPNAADSIVVGQTILAAGASYVLAQGASAFVVCDGAGKWYLLFLSGPGLQPPAFKNRLINGAMWVNQRYGIAAQTITAGAPLTYTADRWYAYCAGANVAGQLIYTSAQLARYRFTGAAGVTGVGFGQRIEYLNSRDMAGQTCTLSFKASSSSLTSLTWTAYYANTTDVFGTLASPTRTQIATGSVAITATEATYSAQIAVPSAAVNGIEIVLSGGALLASQTLTIGDVQFEVGNVATTFEVLPFDVTLRRCLRYFFSANQVNNMAGYVAYPGQPIPDFLYTFPVQMRVAPTVSWMASDGFNAGAGGAIVTAKNFSLSCSGNGSGYTYCKVTLNWADAEL